MVFLKMKLVQSNGRGSVQPAQSFLSPNNFTPTGHHSNDFDDLDEMMDAISNSKSSGNVPDNKKQLDPYTLGKVAPLGEEETTFSGTSGSGTIDTLDFSTEDDIKLLEESDLVKQLTRRMRIGASPNGSRRKKKRSRKVRRESLEQAVSKTILQTAASGASAAHFIIDSDTPDECKTAQYILSDLNFSEGEGSLLGPHDDCQRDLHDGAVSDEIDDLLSDLESTHDGLRAISPVISNEPQQMSRSVNASPIARTVSPEPVRPEPVSLTPESPKLESQPAPVIDEAFPPVESFDSVSWKDHVLVEPTEAKPEVLPAEDAEAAGAKTEAVELQGQVEDSQEIHSVQKEQSTETVVAEQVANEVPKETRQDVVFKTNFEDWTPFDDSQFDDSDFFMQEPEKESFAMDSNGFPIGQPTSFVPTVKPPSPSRKKLFKLSNSSSKSVKTAPSPRQVRHPEMTRATTKLSYPVSPASVSDFRNTIGSEQEFGFRASTTNHSRVNHRVQRRGNHSNLITI